MRYELYEYLGEGIYDYVTEKSNLNETVNIMLELRNKDKKHLIIDNEVGQLINYYFLEFDVPLTKTVHYNTVLDCKFSKYMYQENLADDFIDNYNYIYERVMKKAIIETDKYFEKFYDK